MFLSLNQLVESSDFTPVEVDSSQEHTRSKSKEMSKYFTHISKCLTIKLSILLNQCTLNFAIFNSYILTRNLLEIWHNQKPIAFVMSRNSSGVCPQTAKNKDKEMNYISDHRKNLLYELEQCGANWMTSKNFPSRLKNSCEFTQPKYFSSKLEGQNANCMSQFSNAQIIRKQQMSSSFSSKFWQSQFEQNPGSPELVIHHRDQTPELMKHTLWPGYINMV